MSPSAEFALLAGVGLLGVTAWLGLVFAAWLPWHEAERYAPAGERPPRYRPRHIPQAILTVGCLLLAVADGSTGASLSTSVASAMSVLRAAGAVLLAVAMLFGALGRPLPRGRRRGGRDGQGGGAPGLPAALSLVPLGVSGGASSAVAVGFAFATLAALRTRVPLRSLLVAALGLRAVAAVLEQQFTGTPEAFLVVRGVSTVLLLVVLTWLTRSSLLARVVAAVLAALVVMAASSSAVVGSVVDRTVTHRETTQVVQVTSGVLDQLRQRGQTAQQLAQFLAVCPTQTLCQQAVDGFGNISVVNDSFAATVGASGVTAFYTPAGQAATLDRAAQVELGQLGAVRDALVTGRPAAVVTVLHGTVERLVVLGVVPGTARVDGRPDAPPVTVGVYGFVVDGDLLRGVESGTDLTVTVLSLPSRHVIVSSLSNGETEGTPSADAAALVRRAPTADALAAASGPVARPTSGSDPTVAYTLAGRESGEDIVLAVSEPAATVLHTEREVLKGLYIALLSIGFIVAVFALLVGRRFAAPVRRLTEVATAVGNGDLSRRAEIPSLDELGLFSRAFDTMTSSLVEATERAQHIAGAETEVRARLEAVLAGMGDGLVVVDEAGLIDTVNPAGCAVLGLPERALAGRPLLEVLPLVDGIRAGESVEGEIAGPNGTIPLAVTVSDLPERAGQVVVVRDRSRERQIERMKTEFLANVSHELRTPLTPIRGYAEILIRRPEVGADKVRQFAYALRDSSLRLNRVVNLLVDVAALDAGRVQPEPLAVHVDELVEDRLEAARAKVDGRASDLSSEIAENAPRVLVDPGLLGKVLDELLDNALKYSEPDTPVVVSAVRRGPMLRVSIADRGSGMDADQLAELGDFTQADGSATRRREGLGLGLGFVRRMVDALGVHLFFESTVGVGTTVSIDLPTAVPRPQPRPRVVPTRGAAV
jgi:two-component system phosphate regulon sensor histidine kinase PhoR